MPNILRQKVGSVVSVTTANAIAASAYANSADALRINNGTNKALLADFRLASVTFPTAPVSGSLQLYAVDRDFSGNQGPSPSATMRGRLVGSFDPQPAASNASTGWIMSLNNVAISEDADYWLYNGTGYSLNVGAVFSAQCWTPGTP